MRQIIRLLIIPDRRPLYRHPLSLGASSAARLEEAIAAYRAAFEERTRERVPLLWGMTQTNLGNALQALGEREAGRRGWRRRYVIVLAAVAAAVITGVLRFCG